MALAAALLALLVFPRAACGGAGSLNEAAERYLAAARAGDVGALVALAPSDFEAETAARAKVAAYVRVRESVIGYTFNADDDYRRNGIIHAGFTGGMFRDSVPLRLIWGRWYVLLGHPRDAAP